ncbi:glycosyltransferase involved in cell wall biosynthesis [Marinobacter pelagius]|uniref:Glycosyltransferase involved in cell wall biosynthesis n=1 Tax=Marinobacter pelagius TaxID=379482 RepID=A0A366GQC2_9GAMM|nr:glycosyltransferase family A protein [Marinobacter pelagius]RBP29125.1 glycosyltransferase involved in cell wall biosynthesis [Marinobacter pelagius]
MIFFVFSYNRGPHLKNCIESIEACAPGHRVIVYDDSSDDPETLQILGGIEARHEVRRRDDKGSGDQHGALYTNMQRAIDSLEEDTLICFLQDDTQLVRRIDNQDLEFLKNQFERFPTAGFLAPVFQKRITRRRTLDRFIYREDRGVYVCEHRSKKQVAGVFYSDISVTRSDRLRSVNWQFVPGEFENEQQAKQQFLEMGYLFAPFAMWLPNPPAYRNKKKTFTFRLAEIVNKAGFYPFEIMDEGSVQRLRNRPKNQVPIAEDFLTVKVKGLKSPWIYDPLRRYRLLRKLAKLEAFINRVLNKSG